MKGRSRREIKPANCKPGVVRESPRTPPPAATHPVLPLLSAQRSLPPSPLPSRPSLPTVLPDVASTVSQLQPELHGSSSRTPLANWRPRSVSELHPSACLIPILASDAAMRVRVHYIDISVRYRDMRHGQTPC